MSKLWPKVPYIKTNKNCGFCCFYGTDSAYDELVFQNKALYKASGVTKLRVIKHSVIL